ncbi:MAG: beta-L-arabinofuranosidase domain-containing protein [Terriglobia bacterium]
MAASSTLTRRQFVSTAAAAAGMALLPGHAAAFPGQDPVIDALPFKGRSDGREKVMWKVEPFPMNQVRLLDGPFKQELEINRRWLISLPNDRLLHTCRLNAGIPSTAEPLGGWENPDSEVRGHFANGQYLSACALMHATTGDDEMKDKAGAMVAEMAKCQEAHKNGYLSAFPVSFFDRLREGQPVWAPFYTYHKIMAGLLDMYVHCGNQQALEVAEGMAEWVGHWHESISDEQMQRILQTEFGGLEEGLWNLYAVTGKGQYAETATWFEKTMFFDPLADHRDELKGLHANTHVPQVIGAARRYELTGQPRYHDIASYFWHEVTSERIYCTGGTSNHEYWRTGPGKLASELGEYTEECCVAYNMLKLTRHVCGWTADPRAMDYYERTLFNHRLGAQDANGMKSYFLPLGSSFWKYYNSPWNSFWCCTATGAEEFSKFADTIYFHGGDGVYVNLFIASELNWPEKGMKLRQETKFPEQEGTTLLVSLHQPSELSLHLRIPYWATQGGEVRLNGSPLPVFSNPSSYLEIHRVWKDGDRIELRLPMSLHVHPIPDDHTLQAVMYGPLVLAGQLGDQGITQALTYPGYETAPRERPIPVPAIANASRSPVGWMEPSAGAPLTFRSTGQPENVTLVPLYRVKGQRYAVYWKVDTKTV